MDKVKDHVKSEYPLDWAYRLGEPEAGGVLRTTPDDFEVEEYVPEDVFEEGEHVCFLIEKRGQNTAYVARRLANYAGVREFDVGFCGLKDRHAVTRQWFSIYFGKRPKWYGENLNLEGVRIIEQRSARKKLKRGDHESNRFRITVRQVSGSKTETDHRLEEIGSEGFPNYFGEQRFGRENHNLAVANEWFSGRKRLTVKKGGMYVSAARAYLFNALLSERIRRKQLVPLEGDVKEHGKLALSLFGDGDYRESEGPLDATQTIANRFPILSKGLQRNRIAMAYRPALCIPGNLKWEWENDNLVLTFDLPPGSFATSLLREILIYNDASHETTAFER